jgi:hypothetical protein
MFFYAGELDSILPTHTVIPELATLLQFLPDNKNTLDWHKR